MIQSVVGAKIPSEIQSYEKKNRNHVIRKLKDTGLSIRQISRLTGISFGVIRRI
jgi:putative transposase